MKSRLLFTCIIIVLCLGIAMAFVGCDKSVDHQKQFDQYAQQNIVFLGDSIAEGIAGPAPIEAREDYGYYAILGKINGYRYDNRAISGNLTADLLAVVSGEDDNAYVTITRIKQADIICISISGNDLLFSNFPHLLYEFAAQEHYGDSFVDEQLVKDAYVYHRHGVVKAADGTLVDATPGSGIELYYRVLGQVKTNVTATIAKLRQLNPDAHIFFQNVYNPVDDEAEMIPQDLVDDLMKIDSKYDFSTAEGVANFRRWGAFLLGGTSDAVQEAIASFEDSRIHHVDVSAAFDAVYRADIPKGKDLIFVDGVHPSDQGHALIAATLQQALVDNGLADSEIPLANYKSMRCEQLERSYGKVQGFALDSAKAAVNAADSITGVSDAFFAAIKGYTPTLSTNPTAFQTNGKAEETDRVYEISRVVLTKGDAATQDMIDGYLPIATLIMDEKYLTLGADGVLSLRISAPLGGLLSLLGDFSVDNMIIGGKEDNYYMDEQGNLTNLKLSGALDTFASIVAYADALFPGLDFTGGNLGENFTMLYRSLGIGFEGLDSLLAEPYVDNQGLPLDGGVNWEIDQTTIGARYNSYLDYVVAYLGRFSEVVDAEGKTLHVDRTPAGLTDRIKDIMYVTIKLDTVYSLVDVPSADGKTFRGVYCGAYSDQTSPWLILTQETIETEGEEPVETIFIYLALGGIRVEFTEVAND